MDYEEKYKDALERAKRMMSQKEIEYLFPELKESENERTRKEILNVFKQLDEGATICGRNYDYTKWIAWLENQGEQHSPVDINKMVDEFAHTEVKGYGIPCMIEVDAYRKGIEDALEKQDEQLTDNIEPNPAWSEEDEEMLMWLCRIIHTQRLNRAITLKEESELGEWIDKWLNHNLQTKQSEHLENYDEDERIRKEIVDFIIASNKYGSNERCEAWLNWLEKQGEKDPCIGCTNDKGCMACENGNLKEIKSEPKFHPGDWVILTDTIAQILDKQKYGFVGLDIDGKDFFCNYGHINSMRLWSIEGAKDGDVLVNGSNIFIFHFLNGTRLMGYCHVNIDDGRFYDDIGKNECFCLIDALVTPATKEERDLLFQKMKEAGYEWDAENKELRKIESKKFDADEVVKWICKYWPVSWGNFALQADDAIEQFKKDFGL